MFKTLLASTVLLASTTIFMACSDASTTPTTDGTSQHDGAITGKPGAGGTANPVFVFPAYRTVKARNVATISVCDIDGSDISHVYSNSASGTDTWYPTWSPTGTSVSFVEMPDAVSGSSWYQGAAWGAYAVRVVDVAVSNGVVTGSNTRTLFSTTTGDSMRIISQDWCPSTTGPGAGKIAFMALGTTVSRIYLVPAAGGVATVIYEVPNATNRIRGGSLTWSPDGSRLAFTQYSGTQTADADIVFEIKVIDVAGSVISTLLPGSININQCRWSPTDMGTIMCLMSPSYVLSNNVYSAYTVSTVPGSTPQLITPVTLGSGSLPTWSPNGSEIAYTASNNSEYRINVSTGVSTLLGTTVYFSDWK